jgi:hypothetical protein
MKVLEDKPFSEVLYRYLKEKPYMSVQFRYDRDEDAIVMSFHNSSFPSLKSRKYISSVKIENIKNPDLPFSAALLFIKEDEIKV